MRLQSTFGQLSALFFCTLVISQARAEVWYFPQLQAGQKLVVVNQAPQSQTLWLAPPHRDGNLENETTLEVPARGSLQITPDDLLPEFWSQLRRFSDDGKISVWLSLPTGRWEKIPAGRSSRRFGSPQVGDRSVTVTNLSPIRQEGLIRVRSPQGDLTTVFSLEAFDQLDFDLPVQTGDSEVSVEGQQNLLAHFESQAGPRPLTPAPEAPLNGPGVRFVLSNSARDSSFVVLLEDPKMIQEARDQIRFPDDFRARILIAEVGPGSNQVNQDRISPLLGSWSWHVKRAVTFAQFASQACDGSPAFVEDFLQAWLDANSPICFWSYRVVEELAP